MPVHSFLHKLVFSSISLIYGLFFVSGSRKYLALIESNKKLLGNSDETRVLDIGCGTGAFTWALDRAGFNVTGVDISPAMMRTANRRGLKCLKADMISGIPLEDGSFNLVCAAYVAHGIRKKYREKLYLEARRLTSDTVLFHDYNKHLPFFPIIIIELLETLIGGDFFGFRKNGIIEMREIFREVKEYRVTPSSSWYICRK